MSTIPHLPPRKETVVRGTESNLWTKKGKQELYKSEPQLSREAVEFNLTILDFIHNLLVHEYQSKILFWG